MTDSVEKMRALVQWLKDAPTSVYTFTADGQATVCHPRYLLASDRDVIIALFEREIAALSASGTKSDGTCNCSWSCVEADNCRRKVAPGPSDPIPSQPDEREAIKTALIAAGCDTGDGSYVHAAMDSVIAAILAMLAERQGAEPRGCPTPGACSCPPAPIARLEPVCEASPALGRSAQPARG